jgi:hypothetical protein
MTTLAYTHSERAYVGVASSGVVVRVDAEVFAATLAVVQSRDPFDVLGALALVRNPDAWAGDAFALPARAASSALHAHTSSFQSLVSDAMTQEVRT